LKVNSSDELAKVVQEDSLRFGYDFETNIPYSIFATVYNNNNFEFEEYKPAVKNTDAPKVRRSKTHALGNRLHLLWISKILYLYKLNAELLIDKFYNK